MALVNIPSGQWSSDLIQFLLNAVSVCHIVLSSHTYSWFHTLCPVLDIGQGTECPQCGKGVKNFHGTQYIPTKCIDTKMMGLLVLVLKGLQ